MITIREANFEDLGQVLALYTMLNGEMAPKNDDECKAMWSRMINDEHYHVIVAEEDGHIMSSCTCVILQNVTHGVRPFALVVNVVTDSSFRSWGLATACLEEAKRLAEKANCYKIMLTTNSKLESTVRFYEKTGYNREDKTAFVQWL